MMRWLLLLVLCAWLPPLSAALSDNDFVVLNDEQRIFGTIVDETALMLTIKDRKGRLHKLPQKIIERKSYADGSNWARMHRDLARGLYQKVNRQLEDDMRDTASQRQISTRIFCLAQTSQHLSLANMCHDLCRRSMDRRELLHLLDQFAVSAPDNMKDEQLHSWQQCVRLSRYQLGRRRCAAVLCCLMALHGETDDIDRLRRKQELDETDELGLLMSLLDNVLLTMATEPEAALEALRRSEVPRLMPGLSAEISVRIQRRLQPDQAALKALRVVLDEEVDVMRRLRFAELARDALHYEHKDEAQRVSEICLGLQQQLQQHVIKEDR